MSDLLREQLAALEEDVGLGKGMASLVALETFRREHRSALSNLAMSDQKEDEEDVNDFNDLPRFAFSIDRGGTFTDVYCEVFKKTDAQCGQATQHAR